MNDALVPTTCWATVVRQKDEDGTKRANGAASSSVTQKGVSRMTCDLQQDSSLSSRAAPAPLGLS